MKSRKPKHLGDNVYSFELDNDFYICTQKGDFRESYIKITPQIFTNLAKRILERSIRLSKKAIKNEKHNT